MSTVLFRCKVGSVLEHALLTLPVRRNLVYMSCLRLSGSLIAVWNGKATMALLALQYEETATAELKDVYMLSLQRSLLNLMQICSVAFNLKVLCHRQVVSTTILLDKFTHRSWCI